MRYNQNGMLLYSLAIEWGGYVVSWYNLSELYTENIFGKSIVMHIWKKCFWKNICGQYIFLHTSVKTAHLLRYNTPVAPVSTHHVTALLLGQTRSSLQFTDILAVQFNECFVVISVGLFYLHWLTAPLAWTSCMLHIRLDDSKFLVESIVDLAI
jgi:hypothetical protein